MKKRINEDNKIFLKEIFARSFLKIVVTDFIQGFLLSHLLQRFL